MPLNLTALVVGYAIDLVLGDPHSMPHPVRWIGSLIGWLEPRLRQAFPDSPHGRKTAGRVLVALVLLISGGIAGGVLAAAWVVSPWLYLAAASVTCYWMLATKCLKDESMAVHAQLVSGTLDDARKAVSMIVGRDTANLTAEGVTKAAVETVAENTSDGVVAPLFFMALFGPLGGVLYKAANTMDSMVGYKNERYLDFGRAAAKLDDVLNFVPARLSGVLMCLAAGLCGYDRRGAWRIFRRDRLAHSSPNSAHAEAACAGALGVQLAGPNTYGGVLVNKPTIGDADRPVEAEDIRRANRLLYATSFLTLALCLGLGAALWLLGRNHLA